jgi:NTP pyrophosphatase (non-canonical NTP hydrolase)
MRYEKIDFDVPEFDGLGYKEFVNSLFKDMCDRRSDLMHAAAGIAGESGEVLDIIKKHWAYDKPLQIEKLVEELGDVLFYIYAMSLLIGIDVETIIQYNQHKLSKRYSSGKYSNEQAIARADGGAQ